MTVNGVRHEREVEPRLLLSDFLRQDLGLTGTHVGCEHGVCGACTMLFDGEPVRSCIMLAVQADGHDIQTVEGLASAAGELDSAADRFPRSARPAVRLLHAGLPDDADGVSARHIRARPNRRFATRSPPISAAAPATTTSSRPIKRASRSHATLARAFSGTKTRAC